MEIPSSLKPGLWGAAGGALAMTIVGFWGLGWTTASTADRMGRDRADTAVVSALVPFCVAKAQQDADAGKLVKLAAEPSSYSRSQIVKDAGWATLPGMTAADSSLATACSGKLQAKAG
jgi:hypothetical protein